MKIAKQKMKNGDNNQSIEVLSLTQSLKGKPDSDFWRLSVNSGDLGDAILYATRETTNDAQSNKERPFVLQEQEIQMQIRPDLSGLRFLIQTMSKQTRQSAILGWSS
jgi:hypothetical protein